MKNARFDRNPRIDADVQLLLGRFRNLLPDGRVLQHVEIEGLLQLTRTSSRYRTVTDKWRRVLFDEQHVFLDGRSAHGEGFTALTPDEMIRFANRRVRAVGKALHKAIKIIATPQPGDLTDNSLRIYQARLLVVTEQVLNTHKHALLDMTKALRPAPVLPRASSA
jgi:hypothetical protein